MNSETWPDLKSGRKREERERKRASVVSPLVCTVCETCEAILPETSDWALGMKREMRGRGWGCKCSGLSETWLAEKRRRRVGEIGEVGESTINAVGRMPWT
jgi:hypothetical protein